MNIYYVFHNKTYEYESKGGYLWSPQKNKSGGNNLGYENMSKVKKGDVIFHGANSNTYAISIAERDCYESEQPEENKVASKEIIWNNKGYRVDSDYTILKTPLDMREHFKWFEKNPEIDSAFTIKGKGKQMYLLTLAKEHARYILNNLLSLSQNDKDLLLMESILRNILNENLPEYSERELNHINEMIESEETDEEKPEWKGQKREKEFSSSDSTGAKKAKRKSVIAANALEIADYLCEYNNQHKVFLRKNGRNNYTEPHHLIPLSNHKDFEFNLDVEENIVSLCSHCHNLLHYGRFEDKEVMLRDLYDKRRNPLKEVGLNINHFDELKKYYL